MLNAVNANAPFPDTDVPDCMWLSMPHGIARMSMWQPATRQQVVLTSNFVPNAHLQIVLLDVHHIYGAVRCSWSVTQQLFSACVPDPSLM